jgi:hypothetical protein
MNGNSMPHSYLIASTNADESSILVHVNAEHGSEYTDSRVSTLEMEWASQPSTVTASPASAMTSQSWDESSSTLTLVLSHSNGAVEVTVSQ